MRFRAENAPQVPTGSICGHDGGMDSAARQAECPCPSAELAEWQRLQEADSDGVPGGEDGALLGRAGLGHCPGGLLAPTARPGRTSLGSKPFHGPTAGTRTAWPASATTTSWSAWHWALWNGQDPLAEGEALRPDQLSGQPRRGREGMLVVPRRHADVELAPVALPLPPGRVPLRRPCGPKTPDAAVTNPSTSSSTPGSSTPTATSSSPSRGPRPAPRTSFGRSR